MGSNKSGSEDATAKFMLAEYDDLCKNVMHLENKLFSHLSFYTTLFMAIVTASIAILQLVENGSTPLTKSTVLFLLSLLFCLFLIVGRFELRMTTELRIRKMKFIEGITQIRQYFVDQDESLVGYLMLPVSLQKAPPYLRVRSKDWYQVIYISLMNGFAAFIAWVLFLAAGLVQLIGRQIGWLLVAAVVVIVLVWLFIGVLIFYLIFWEISYRSVMDFCKSYDERREKKMGEKSKYDLFELPIPKSWLKRTFGDWIWLIEERGKTRNE